MIRCQCKVCGTAFNHEPTGSTNRGRYYCDLCQGRKAAHGVHKSSMKRVGREPLGYSAFIEMTEGKRPTLAAAAPPLIEIFDVPIGTAQPAMAEPDETESLRLSTPIEPWPAPAPVPSKVIFVAPMNGSLFMVGEMDMTTTSVRNLINTTTMPEAEAFAAGYRAAMRDAQA